MGKRLAGALLLTSCLWAGSALADDVYDACINANEPTYEDAAKQAGGCQCAVDKIGDNADLRAEAISISAMTAADRDAAASEEAKAIIGECFPTE